MGESVFSGLALTQLAPYAAAYLFGIATGWLIWGGRRGVSNEDAAAARLESALQTAERVTRREGADGTADTLHSMRSVTGVLDPSELPIAGYDELNLSEAATAVKDLTDPADLRVIIAYEETHRNRQRVVSAAQTRVAAIAQEIVGID